jgi:hypothetical protein
MNHTLFMTYLIMLRRKASCGFEKDSVNLYYKEHTWPKDELFPWFRVVYDYATTRR